MPAKKINPIFLYEPVNNLCTKPYYNHKKGCPNFGKKEGCPPVVKPLDLIFNFNESIFVIWNIFNLATHINKMRSLHPAWTMRQLECCLYWQPRARKQLKLETDLFVFEHQDYIIINCPEAHSIDVTKTMSSIGEALQWPPINTTYQIAFAGKPCK